MVFIGRQYIAHWKLFNELLFVAISISNIVGDNYVCYFSIV